MATIYIALLRKEKKSDYGVDFPDFPGCITAGKTLDEAKDLAEEALQFHIDGMLEDGCDIPDPSSLEQIMADSENADAIPFLVSVRPRKVRAKRINITFPEDTLEEVDDYVKEHPGQNRSRVLAEAVKNYIRPSGKRSGRQAVGTVIGKSSRTRR